MKVITSTQGTGRSVAIPSGQVSAIEVEPYRYEEWALTAKTASGHNYLLARGSQAFVTRQYDLLLDELCGGPRRPSPWGGVGYEHVVEAEEVTA